MGESDRYKETAPTQEIPLTPLGIILACKRLIDLKPLLERHQPHSQGNLSMLNESERALFERFPPSQVLTVITEDGLVLHYAETTVNVNGMMVARERTYIGAPTLPEDRPCNSYELFGQTLDSDGKPLPVEIALRRYPGVIRKPNGYFAHNEKISFIDGNLIQPGYNPHFQAHRLTSEAAKDLADLMNIPPQYSMR